MSTIIVANWKMNPRTLKEAEMLFGSTKQAVAKRRGVEVIVAPPAVYLRSLSGSYSGKAISFAAQDVHFESEGSFTGNISVPQMADAGATYCIVGHSERRAQGETNEDVRRKTKAVVDAGLTAIVCIGENERDSGGRYLHEVRSQLVEGIAEVSKKQLGKIIIAYEPVWAVGVDEAMDSQQMHEMSIYIRKILNELHGAIGMNITVLYGGSVSEVRELAVLKGGDVGGLLIGRASIDPDVFATLLENI